MIFDFFILGLKGVVVGFVIAAPIGPTGVLLIRRTLSHGQLAGVFTGLGAAIADAFYAFIAALGLSLVQDVLTQYQAMTGILGAALLFTVGIGELRNHPPATISDLGVPPGSLLSDFLTACCITLFNPVTLLSFLAVMAGLGVIGEARGHLNSPEMNHFAAIGIFVASVFIGSLGWWLFLTHGADFVRHRLEGRMMRRLNIASGIALIGFGAFVLIRGFS